MSQKYLTFPRYFFRHFKQLSISQVDEVVYVSQFDCNEPAHHSHDWLDDNGKNDWEKRIVLLQEKNNAVWEATLQVATTTNGEKVLYEIYPIKMVEGPGTSGATTTISSIQQGADKSQEKISNSLRSVSERQTIVSMLNSLPYEVEHAVSFYRYWATSI